mmetsp:Transcript_23497/g.41573  ORF Transcript_23497/g.41573 Transcript_23497/m.41573 type:complete len:239 (-) Transcript_23497:673-1389(-)
MSASDSTSDRIRTPNGDIETTEILKNLLNLEKIKENVYRGNSQYTSWGRIFGGQLMAQGLMASFNTVPDGYPCNAFHAQFLRSGSVEKPVVLTVERVRNGRSFINRSVDISQDGELIFRLSASFHKIEIGVTHRTPMAEYESPETCAKLTENGKIRHYDPRIKPPAAIMQAPRVGRIIDENPFSLVGSNDKEIRGKPTATWIRIGSETLPQDNIKFQQCGIAYFSDWALSPAGLYGHG